MSVKLLYVPLGPRLKFLKTPFFALLMAIGLFIGTIYALPFLSEFWVDTFVLKSGTVATMGITPKSQIFQGSIVQKQAFENPRILPLYGSSEMSMIIDYHPANVLTPETGVTPFLVGKGGAQTLIQLLNVAALGEEVRGKKLAIFLTPQWYGPGGISEDTFAGNFSALHGYEILKNPALSGKLKTEVAQRFLQFTKAYQDFPYLKKMLLLQGQSGLSSQLLRILYALPAQTEYAALALQDASKTNWYINQLPTETVAHYATTSTAVQTEPQWDELRAQATEQAKNSTNNNPFEMDNGFFTKNILPNLQAQKDSSKDAEYVSSPEYGDLQLLLDVLKQEGAQPLFVILPMNGRWSDYTGIPTTVRQVCYQKIAQMIQAQGFTLADYSAHEKDDYYLRDPWHLAWRGWLDVDQTLYQFYQSK
ncbi:D-alanyl-lipoteichoic acid biosynthesis protein DltD [Desulfitobacterium metallireducens]|uniref:D-alanyl-lipoteichoic acid biosynthesis protein DltD n=1 Tax=Desulfitobacterium metallireducens TaxID=142877 RepID=UPI00023149BD|nr:D-alanyl-lipoteichoic acid biosynthesis protein DltD [Desulfitobacterium metallireducens]